MLGTKVNALRKAKGLTLKELGESANLSASFISQVERGLASPTVISLAQIAHALGVGPSYFFPPPPQDGPVVRSYSRHPFQVAEAEVFYARLGEDFSDRVLEPLVTTYPPGFVSEEFRHPGEEFVFVLEGQVVFVLSGVEYVMTSGDSIHYPSDQPHHLENRGEHPVHMVYVTTPPFLSYRARGGSK